MNANNANKYVYVTEWVEGSRLVPVGYGIEIRKTRSGKILGYEGFVMENVPASYVIEEEYGRAGIRVTASISTYEEMHLELEARLEKAGIDAVASVSYDSRGFVELSYYGYSLEESEQALKVLKECALMLKSATQLRS
ncbi:MAG: hypothetical protein ACP5RP_02000 [Candidatus Micrarchaeia archaeon]